MVTENALDDLNSRVQTEPIPINRFRPNVIVRLPEGGSAHGRKYPEVSKRTWSTYELLMNAYNLPSLLFCNFMLQDSWTVFMVGSTKLRVQRPCTR